MAAEQQQAGVGLLLTLQRALSLLYHSYTLMTLPYPVGIRITQRSIWINTRCLYLSAPSVRVTSPSQSTLERMCVFWHSCTYVWSECLYKDIYILWRLAEGENTSRVFLYYKSSVSQYCLPSSKHLSGYYRLSSMQAVRSYCEDQPA